MKIVNMLLLLVSGAAISSAQIVISDFPFSHSESFDSLASTGTSALLPNHWFLSESGPSSKADGSYRSGTGSASLGDTYSLGSSGERALGEVTTGTLLSSFGAQLQNSSGSVLNNLQIGYVGEQWRRGSATADRLDFSYSLDATSLSDGTWSDVDSLDFHSVQNAGSSGALDGNLMENQSSISGSLTGLSIEEGDTFWIRWAGFDVVGSDHGLAIDNLTLAAVPEPEEYALVFGSGLVAFATFRRFRNRSSEGLGELP